MGGSADWPFEGEWQGFFDLAQAGRLNVFYLSGAQIDGQGNINLMALGDYRQPKVRLPGGAGSAILAYVVERVVLFKTTHEARGLVPQVDLITAPGFTPNLSLRQRPGRIIRLITPKCVFALDQPQAPLAGQSPSRRHPGRSAPAHRLRVPHPAPDARNSGLNRRGTRFALRPGKGEAGPDVSPFCGAAAIDSTLTRPDRDSCAPGFPVPRPWKSIKI